MKGLKPKPNEKREIKEEKKTVNRNMVENKGKIGKKCKQEQKC